MSTISSPPILPMRPPRSFKDKHAMKIKGKQSLRKRRFPKSGDLKKRLYIRMPYTIKESIDISNLHPLITRVVLPRQSARFCYVEFNSKRDADQALRDMADLKAKNGRRIHVEAFLSKPDRTPEVSTEPINIEDVEPVKFRIQKTGRKNVKNIREASDSTKSAKVIKSYNNNENIDDALNTLDSNKSLSSIE